MSVLYSCMGTTDPVRGMRDGGLMHIMRQERPDTVYLFLSAEIIRFDRQDDRIRKTFDYIREHWDYSPTVVRYETDIQDPSDLDALAGPMEDLLQNVFAAHPGTEVLMNLSSGTPQMEILMVQMTQDPRYGRIRGIQVKSPEKKAGTAERTNTKRFPVDEALELNEDEEAGQPNRCVEPRLMAIRRDAVRKQLKTLIRERNYAAVAAMGSALPAPYPQLARHLDLRCQFQLGKAEEAAKGLNIKGLQLQGRMPDIRTQRRQYRQVEMVEYFAMLKHLVHLERYTEFILRLNPLLIRLQLTLLDALLKDQDVPYPLTGSADRRKVTPQYLADTNPALLAALVEKFGPQNQERDVSISALNIMLKHYGLEEKAMTLLEICEAVNTRLRNDAAHDFFSITDEIIHAVSGKTTAQLVRELEDLLVETVEQQLSQETSGKNWGLHQRLNVYANCDKLLLECL